VNDLFLIAEIRSAFGQAGCVQIESYSDFKDRFFDLKKVFVEIFGTKKELFVEYAKEIDRKFVLKFVGFDSCENVEILLGKKLYVDDEGAVKPSEDTYFIHDLIGSEVVHNGNILGVVEDVFAYPANDVIVALDKDNRRISIPAIKDFIKGFDAGKKRLELTDGSELLYDDEI
jgi:16S rRNA processing protein RimM